MRMSFGKLYGVLLAALLALALWSVWDLAAQGEATGAATNALGTATNSVNAGETQGAGKIHRTPDWVQQLSGQFPFLQQTLWGNELWKYLFSLLYIFLAFYISKFLDYLTRVWLKRWAARTQTQFDDLLLEVLNGPIKIVSFIILLKIGLDVFEWPDVVEKILDKGFTIVVAVSLTYMVMKFVDLFINFWRKRKAGDDNDAFNQQLFPIIRRSLKAFVIIVAALVTLDNLGVNITAAIASLSIGGLAVGLAAQDTLANLFGGITIFLDKPFRIGDRIVLDKIDGPVESIGLRSTRVRSLDGFLVTIPNKTMGNATIINISARPTIQTVMNIGITYDTPTEQVKHALKIIEDVYKGHPGSSNCLISFNKFADSALNILVIHWWHSTNYAEYLNGMQEMNLALKERFDAAGIGFAFPTQTLYVKQDSDWRLSQPR
ncbi:MAG TPA: mechanosensitive ion channel family protein [Verrucomicrobiota bacterium]|nr:mechanosensitive ion channel family protein [Verrucomicrobiota bacterium]HNT15486.1 mechanosensitive ion channel family protein [Verrucomicrobiota bacterium]